MTIIIQLDSVKKYGKSKKEWRTVNKASTTVNNECVEVVGDGEVIKKLLSKLYTENKCDINTQVEVKRGDIPSFVPMSLKSWLFPEDRRPEHLKKTSKK
jgi:hypothetical protein